MSSPSTLEASAPHGPRAAVENQPAQTFSELGVSPASVATLRRLGISVPTPIQAQAIPAMLDGRDVVGQARTGSGKTLAFALPIAQRCKPGAGGVQALILVPTRELAIQVAGVLQELTKEHRLRLTLLYGGRSLMPERAALRTAEVVVGTPGRTLDHLQRGDLKLDRVQIVILDEGDEMLDRGFAPDVERILAKTPTSRQTAMFSATMPEWVAATAARHLKNPVTVEADSTLTAPPEIQHVVYEIDPSAKVDVLAKLLDERAGGSVLVFGRTKHGVKKLAKQFSLMGYPVGALQGNLSQNARERVLADFRSRKLPILFATNVAARGLDIEHIGQVINYELPESAELFTHRVGRTGRMGREGEAITFMTPGDAGKLKQIERMLGRRLPRMTYGSSSESTADQTAKAARTAVATAEAQKPRRKPEPPLAVVPRDPNAPARPPRPKHFRPRHLRHAPAAPSSSRD